MSNTANLDLERPDKGDTEWHTSLNSNMTKLDTGYGNNVATVADLPQVYIETGTFNFTTGDTITLPVEVDATNEYSVEITPTSRAGAIGDIYVTKTTTNFVVKCAENNTTDTFEAIIYYIGDIASYGGSIYRRWYVSTDAGITDHGDTADTGSFAWVLDQIGATPATVELPGNKVYLISTTLAIADNIKLIPQMGAILTDDGSNADLTISGSIDAGLYQIFDWGNGSGNLTFGDNSNKDIMAEWFGYSVDETAVNNDIFFNTAVASMSAGQRLNTGYGDHLIANVTFNPPDGCSWINYGILESDGETGVAVTIGDAAGATYVMKYNIQNLKIVSTAKDHTVGRIGVLLRNVYESYIDIRYVYGFQYGVKLYGDVVGCVYNEIHLGTLWDNKYSLFLTAANSGWCNENHFYGGRYYWSSAQDTAGYIHIWIDYYVTNKLNNNRFYNPSLESSASTGADTAIGIYCEGIFSYFYTPRFELDTANTFAEYTANATSNTIFYGYGLLSQSYVTDAGVSNDTYSKNDVFIRGGSAASADGVLRVLNESTEASAPALSVHGTDGVSNARIFGDGDIDTDKTYQVGGVQVVTSRQTGVSAMTNITAPSNLDCDTVNVAELADIVGTLITKLRAHGLVGN